MRNLPDQPGLPSPAVRLDDLPLRAGGARARMAGPVLPAPWSLLPPQTGAPRRADRDQNSSGRAVAGSGR